MNRTYLIAGIAILGLAALVLGLVFTIAGRMREQPTPLTTTQGATTAPTSFKVAGTIDKGPVATCYAWYIQALIDDAAYTNPEGYLAQLHTCFTDRFIASWPAISESTGVDPVLLSQDFDPSWVSAITVEKVNADTVLVTLGGGESAQVLIVRFSTENGVTRVNSVAPRTP